MEDFQHLLHPVTKVIAGSTFGKALEARLNDNFPAGGALFKQIEQACHTAISAGWMCTQGDEGRRFGRIIEPSPKTGGLSVDVVQLNNVTGPHHRHPSGEVCMIMPQDKLATFDGHGAGWCVYSPGTAHFPTVRNGNALILYLLPDGKIEFTGKTLK
ncbi:hypothetical protein MNBD_ALPHA08-1700 [hydrothermal vent metagenome]|uniref:p-hydroxylaminobenzoate lyase n=1 Tax=hydrothermal vent metagenome TaxID=652676 RepID=A0A3B0RD50_9ZZZZ